MSGAVPKGSESLGPCHVPMRKSGLISIGDICCAWHTSPNCVAKYTQIQDFLFIFVHMWKASKFFRWLQVLRISVRTTRKAGILLIVKGDATRIGNTSAFCFVHYEIAAGTRETFLIFLQYGVLGTRYIFPSFKTSKPVLWKCKQAILTMAGYLFFLNKFYWKWTFLCHQKIHYKSLWTKFHIINKNICVFLFSAAIQMLLL